jgi:hypothetical protein
MVEWVFNASRNSLSKHSAPLRLFMHDFTASAEGTSNPGAGGEFGFPSCAGTNEPQVTQMNITRTLTSGWIRRRFVTKKNTPATLVEY